MIMKKVISNWCIKVWHADLKVGVIQCTHPLIFGYQMQVQFEPVMFWLQDGDDEGVI